MRSNFDSPLKIVNGTINACGELEWETGENEAIVSATITQKGEKVAGTASSPPNFAAGETEWMLDVNPASVHKFKKGPARATGVVCAMGDDIDVNVFHWSQDVVLED
jgi:hypothetical protein